MPTKKIAFIQAAWHQDIVGQCRESFLAHLGDSFEVEIFEVPGSLEMPLMAKKLAETGQYAAVCCAGFVVDGGIYRHEFVAHAILQGLVKSLVFAVIITLVGVSNGFAVTGGAEGVGRSTTRSVVLAIFYIVLADMTFTYFLNR